MNSLSDTGSVGRTRAVDSSNVLHAVRTDQSAGAYGVCYANSNDGGQTWSDMEVATDVGDAEVKSPSPAVGPDGILHVMWSDQRSGAGQEAVFARIWLTPVAPE